MGRVAKLTSTQIADVVALGVELGPAQASKELLKIGIRLSPGGVFYWMKKDNPFMEKKRAPKTRKTVIAPK